MADLQEIRPRYPAELIEFIASKTPNHDLVWDVGCGKGQASILLAGVYKNVVGTDRSKQQLASASKLPNIRYVLTPPKMTLSDLQAKVLQHQTADLVTVAQAIHCFHLSTFYEQVKCVLKNPNGVLAVWCYKSPMVNEAVDTVYLKLYAEDPGLPARKLALYTNLDFPFQPVDGMDHTGPFEFVSERKMDLDNYLTYIKSAVIYQAAKSKGVELLSNDVIEDFERAWASEDGNQKVVRQPVFLRIGKVGV